MKIEKTLKTRRFVGDDQVTTVVTFDLTDLTEADMRELLIRSAAITLQGAWRRKNSIPKGTYYHKIPKPGTRTAGQMTADTLLRKMFGDVHADSLVEEFGDAETAKNAVMEMMKDRKK